MNRNKFRYLGVDGCRAGWIAVYKDLKENWMIEIYSDIFTLYESHSEADLILIDIPIGLLDNGEYLRSCDKEARKILGKKRASSIFPPPCRSALYSNNYEDANRINREITGKGLSKQSWNISSKIRQLDILLSEKKELKDIFYESHPEVCFTALMGENPPKHYKKTIEGINERQNLLEKYIPTFKIILKDEITKFKKSEVMIDDILDAWVLALIASKGKENLVSIPQVVEFDSQNLPMRIVYSKF